MSSVKNKQPLNSTGSLKKWYEDDDITVTEKEEERQLQFSQGNIGFDAIKVKIQETYEIGVLKLFIETEILKSGSGSFEPGTKNLYDPYTMTKPFQIGRNLLFTSDIEFSEIGFMPGSLQDDRRKYFLHKIEFNNYLLRLPKPISDIESPISEKTDSNAYKYLQILGSETQNRIAMLCDSFIKYYNMQKITNSNAITAIQKELEDIKLIANMTPDDKMKLQDTKQKQLIKEENNKTKLKTKYENYKAACRILSTRRMNYDVTLRDRYPETVKDAISYSRTIIDWLKYKQNSPTFIRDILQIFKPTMSDKILKDKTDIGGKIENIATKLTEIFKPIIEKYFFDYLGIFNRNGNIIRVAPPEYLSFLRAAADPLLRGADPRKYSINNINSNLSQLFYSTFKELFNRNIVNEDDKNSLYKLYFISSFMMNFNSNILSVFSLNKKDGGIQGIFEDMTNESFLKNNVVVNKLYHEMLYLSYILTTIQTGIRATVALAGVVGALTALALPPAQQVDNVLQNLDALIQLVDSLVTDLNTFRTTVRRNNYKTILGESSHAAFVESIFTEKVPPISNVARNNKFLVVSEFIADVDGNSPVIITIPNDSYTFETLGNVIEKELCDKCRWIPVVAANRTVKTIWSCTYDEEKKIKLKLYFPQDNLLTVNNIIPNIHNAYQNLGIPENNSFQITGAANIAGGRPHALTIPPGEYRDVQQVLTAMEKTINDFIGKLSNQVNPPYTTKIKIMNAANRVVFEFKTKKVGLPQEILTITLGALLNVILGGNGVAFTLHSDNAGGNNDTEIMANPVPVLLTSRSVTIQTRMTIDGDLYDASGILGIPSSSLAVAGEITMIPDVIVRDFGLAINDKLKMSNILDDYLGFSTIPVPLGPILLPRIADYGNLNFFYDNYEYYIDDDKSIKDKGFKERIKMFFSRLDVSNSGFRVEPPLNPDKPVIKLDVVDLDKISRENKNVNENIKLKNEIMENTGLYISNELLQAKVPVITNADILNSLFYRYPCIPSPRNNVVEGTATFDTFIEQRVNASKYKEFFLLGKGNNNSSESISFTIRKALEKTLMYDDCDEERSQLMCDLHYAICGPVFTNTTATVRQNREINELDMNYQFQLEFKRPNILDPAGPPPVAPLPPQIVYPFTVKGITPYYDGASKHYKYLIYGHYKNVNFPNVTTGCVKYYDPGTKIGPQPKALQLYDILRFTTAAGGGLNTVTSVFEMDVRVVRVFVYPVFIITGLFDRVEHLDEYGNNVNGAAFIMNARNIVAWSPGKNGLGLPYDNSQQAINNLYDVLDPTTQNEIIRIMGPPPRVPPVGPSNTFQIFWNIENRAPAYPISSNIVSTIDLNPDITALQVVVDAAFLNSVMKFSLKLFYSVTNRFFIIKKRIADDGTKIFLPYYAAGPVATPNEILAVPAGAPLLEISCGAVSVNKDYYNTVKQIELYRSEYCPEITTIPVNTIRLDDIQDKIDALTRRLSNPAGNPNPGLQTVNPIINTNLLWIGLKKRCEYVVAGAQITVREILSCSLIQSPVAAPQTLALPLIFQADDFIENIKVDINDPEIVTVFGKFTATIRGVNGKPDKTIRNAMVIYTNLMNDNNNSNVNFGNIAAPIPYSLEYDNFQPITINSLLEFQGYYSCIDGLVVVSNQGGTMQKNMGILLVKKTQIAPNSIIGFHDNKITEITIDTQHNKVGDLWSSMLCYDYNMCADIIQYDETDIANRVTKIDKGFFNPLSFNAFKTTAEDGVVDFAAGVGGVPIKQPVDISELFNGEYTLVAFKNSRSSKTPSNLHVLNTWGIDLSSERTPFYRRIYESKKFNLALYDKYINQVVGTILGSAKKYYEDKIKGNIDKEFGTIVPNITIKRQGNRNLVITGGGRREDAEAMIMARQIELDEFKKLERYKNKGSVIKQTIEIRVPDIMMSDVYLAKLKDDEKAAVRKSFFDALYKYSNKLYKNAEQQNVIKDIYKIVLCSKSNTFNRFNGLYEEKKSKYDGDDLDNYFTVLENDIYDYGVIEENKNVILVNEWNDRGFIGDYGAFAGIADGVSSLTPNQMIVSNTVKVTQPAGAANPVTEIIPKVPNSSFLLNPFIAYRTFDSKQWSGFNSIIENGNEVKQAVQSQVGGGDDDYSRLIEMQRQQQYLQGYPGVYPQVYPGYLNRGYGQNDPRQRYFGNDDEVLKVQNKMFEKTNVTSTKVVEVSMQAMLQYKLKRVVLWLCDFREGKMLMQKNQIGTVVNLSLPSQSQGDPNGLNGYTLLEKLCKKYFNTESVRIKWTLEFVYIYKDGKNSDGKNSDVGVFIYNAKTNDLPKETMKTQYVSMKVVYNLTKEPSKSVSGKEVKIYEGDINIIYEIFQVVALIRGGLISSASKEFNEVLARLSSRTVPPHLLSIISESKRKNNIEANINFLIKLFFPPNNLFFLSGRLPYYIHSSQRNCPIYTIVKQETYDNDSYLTCLKLFLQSETDFKNKDNMNNLRVGCAVKKKLITDNFSAVWDNFWSDLVQSEEQTEFDDDLERVGVATEEATAKKKDGDDGDDDEDDNALCLVKAIQSGDQMYEVRTDWDIGEYYPISYKDIYYNISPNGNYKFNNEFFHHLNLNELPLVLALGPPAPPIYTGFECMKYYKNGNNPVLFLGGNTGVFKLDLKTYKFTRFITAATTLVFGGGGGPVTPVVKCMDILDIEEGYMLVGGNFTTLTTFDYDNVNNIQIQKFNKGVLCYAAMINLKTYEIINLYNDIFPPPPARPIFPVVDTNINENNVVSKICICKNKKIIKKKGLGNQEKDIYGYIAMIGGFFQIMTVTNDNNPPPGPPPALATQNNIEKIINIGCVLININNAAAPSARLLAVDSKASLVDPAPPAPANIANSSGIFVNHIPLALVPPLVERVLVTSIVCNENEVDNDDDDDEKKKETVFFIGGKFDRYTYIDYPAYEAAKAAAIAAGGPLPRPVIAFGNCNSIIKLTLSCEYDNDDVVSKYNQKSIFEPIDVNVVGNNDTIFYASLVYKEINSKKYLFCLTGFIRVAALLLAPVNAVYTRLNIFDVESKVNYQTPQDITYNGYVQVLFNNYMFQTLLLTVTNNNNKNNKNNAVSKDDEYVLMISFTTLNGAVNTNYIGTCNVSNLNKNPATPVEIEIVSAFSNINLNIPNNDSVTDMCVIKNNTNDNVNAFNVFVSHKNSSKPLTVRSNYQEIGDWNMMSASTDNENDKLSMFIKKILEMKKMFELNPSMFLFLQNIDMRNYNTRITKIVLDNMRANLLAQARVGTPGIALFYGIINAVGASSIDIFSACNDIDQKIMNIVNFIYIYKTTTENLIPVVVPALANLNIDARDIHIKI